MFAALAAYIACRSPQTLQCKRSISLHKVIWSASISRPELYSISTRAASLAFRIRSMTHPRARLQRQAVEQTAIACVLKHSFDRCFASFLAHGVVTVSLTTVSKRGACRPLSSMLAAQEHGIYINVGRDCQIVSTVASDVDVVNSRGFRRGGH